MARQHGKRDFTRKPRYTTTGKPQDRARAREDYQREMPAAQRRVRDAERTAKAIDKAAKLQRKNQRKRLKKQRKLDRQARRAARRQARRSR